MPKKASTASKSEHQDTEKDEKIDTPNMKQDESDEETKPVRRSVRKVNVVKEPETKKMKVSSEKVAEKNEKADIEEEKTIEKETITTVEVKKKGGKKEKTITDKIEKEVTKKIKTNDSKEKIVEIEKTEETKEVKIHEEKDHAQIDITTTKSTTIEKLLPREFYKTDVVTLSRELIGKIIVRKYGDKVLKARIVEAEAYAGIPDKACHAYNGKKTERNKSMYLEGGHIYVYSIYGNNNCLNVTASKEGDPSATLIRAVEIIEGYDIAKANRNVKNLSKSGKELTNGPGKVCAAMNIDKTFNGVDVTQAGGLYIIDEDPKKYDIMTTKRINIDYAEEYVHKPWRFCMRGNLFVSVKAPEVDPEPLVVEEQPADS